MADIGKFIFTNEGKRMLIAQNGGIHFAIMGAILLTRGFDFEGDTSEIEKLTWEDLKAGKYGTLGLKGIVYTTNGEGSEILTSDSNYNAALDNILSRDSTKSATYLFDTQYTPDLGVKDQTNNVYGLYSFAFDKTKFNCDGYTRFRSILLIGKQYITDADAKYNVDETQEPTVVGVLTTGVDDDAFVAEFDNGSDEASRNTYTEFKFEWRITITENPITNIDLEVVEDLKDANDKFKLSNDGLKTNNQIKLTVDDKEIYQYNLNKEGNFATSKAVMVADVASTDDMDEQWNSPGLLHLINKHKVESDSTVVDPNDPNIYKPQQIISTFKYGKNEDDPIDAYHVRHVLTASNDSSVTFDAYDKSCVSDPTYTVDSITDNISTDIFGLENKSYNNAYAKFLYTTANIAIGQSEDTEYEPNTFIGGGQNVECESYGNVLINGYTNTSRGTKYVSYLNAGNNEINEVEDSILLNSNYNSIYLEEQDDDVSIPYYIAMLNGFSNVFYGANMTTVVNSVECEAFANPYIKGLNIGTKNVVFLNGFGLKGISRKGLTNDSYYDSFWKWDRQTILGTYNAMHKNYEVDDETDPEDYDPVNSVFTIGAGADDYYRRNALEFNFHNYLYDESNSNKVMGWEGELVTDYLMVRRDAEVVGDLSVGNTLTANRIETYNLKASNINVGNQTLDSYINAKVETSVGTEIDSSYIIEKLKNKSINLGNAAITASTVTPTTINATNVNATNYKVGSNTLDQYVNNLIDQRQVSNSSRKYTATIIYKNDGTTTLSNLKFNIEHQTDTGGLTNSPMATALSNWINYGMLLGYFDGNDDEPDEDVRYWRGTNGMVQAPNIPLEPYPANPGANISVFPIFWGHYHQGHEYENPMSMSFIPAGYDEIELNIYVRNIGNNDIILPFVPCVARNQYTKVRVNIILGWEDNGGEDIWFWQTKKWMNQGADIWTDLQNTDPNFDYVELTHIDLDKYHTLCLEAIACPHNIYYEGSSWTGTKMLGWHIMQD